MRGVMLEHTERKPIYTGSKVIIKPNYIVTIPQFHSDNPKPKQVNFYSLRNLKENDHKGAFSLQATKKIKNAINWLVVSAKHKPVYDKKTMKTFYFKVNFITLTIPESNHNLTDNYIKKNILHTWLQYARKYFGLRNYVWRAEVQKNNMLHFHICTDTFLHHKRIKDSWNKLLKKHNLLNRYFNKYGHFNPNSTDVHSVKNIKKLGAYLSKYMAKTDTTKRAVSGRLWGCNYDLSHKNECFLMLDPEEYAKETKTLYCKEIQYKPIESKPDLLGRCFQFASLFLLTIENWLLLKNGLIYKAFKERCFAIRNNSIQMTLDYYTIN